MALRAQEDVGVLLVDLDEPCSCAPGPVPHPERVHHPWRRRVVEAAVLAVLAPVVLGDLLPPPAPLDSGTALPSAPARAPGPWADVRTAERAAVAQVRSASLLAVVVPADAHRGSAPLPVMLTERGVRYVVVLSCLRPPNLDVRLDVGLAGQEPASLPCPSGAPVYRFTGPGHLVQVVVDVPDDVVWAAEVVTA